MTGTRVAKGGLIDRSASLNFQFDGKSYKGHPGDTIASALIANGVRIMGRSFKYHRPRGAWSGWFDDPNAIFNIRLGGDELTNCPATTTTLEDGMEARSVNAFPSAKFDIKGGLDRFHRFMPAGFYYKMFMWPDWHLFEPSIRKMAGLGKLDGHEIEGYQSDQIHDHCDLLVVGAGAAGLEAARTAAKSGMSVVLVDDHRTAGGSLYQMADVEGVCPSDWVHQALREIKAAGGRVLPGATAYGIYDHRLVAIAQERGFGLAPLLIRMRVGRCLLASGALDRPVTFADNDRPGVMSLNGAADLLARYGVLVGERLAVMAPHALAADQVALLRQGGASVEIVENIEDTPEALGGKRLRGLRANGRTYDCDTILTSAGLMPVVHLWRHAGGKLRWDDTMSCFVPDSGPDWIEAIGAANGTFELEDALAEAQAKVGLSAAPARRFAYYATPPLPVAGSMKRQWIDLLHDVTLKDIALAARENYVSVEHLKRYTTWGMASDQGKTSNVAGLSAMAAIQGKSIPQVGTTTFRPPFVPVPLELYRGVHKQQQNHPLKRLALEPQHRSAGAAMGEYGGWLRPGWYGQGEPIDIVNREVLMARGRAGIFDGSPLGKIEILGPDAEAFVNFIYYNTIKTLKPGFIRYGFMLTEGGVVYDDGVIARVDDDRFIISCSSSHVDGVNALLEGWRQDGHDPEGVFVHDTTAHWSTVTIAGPKAREILGGLDLAMELSAGEFPHMGLRETCFAGRPARVARVSFTGDVSFEVSVPSSLAPVLWDAAIAIGARHGAGPIGLEALSILRAEKGYVVIGRDTDGETMPHDLGFGIPRLKKTAAFVGDRALHNAHASREERRHFIGLDVPEGSEKLANGAHFVKKTKDGFASCGYVTSSYDSPTLGRPIALGLMDASLAREGTEVEVFHLGETRRATVTRACFFDPDGERLNA